MCARCRAGRGYRCERLPRLCGNGTCSREPAGAAGRRFAHCFRARVGLETCRPPRNRSHVAGLRTSEHRIALQWTHCDAIKAIQWQSVGR
jgi:hypothetical protein